MGNTYPSVKTDIESGSGSVSTPSPRVPSASNQNRHCDAWEDTTAAINKLCDILEVLGAPVADLDEVRELQAKAIMHKNTGE